MPKYITISTYEGEFTYELASFGERLVARIIDTLIIAIPNAFLPLLAGWLYWAILQGGRHQATLGQRALQLKVVDLKGGSVGFGQASISFFANFLNIITLFIGYLMFFFNKRNQCLHDHLAGCVVVRGREISREDDLTRHLVDE